MRVIVCLSFRHFIRSHLIEVILCLQVRLTFSPPIYLNCKTFLSQTVYYYLAGSIGQYIYDYYLRSYVPAATLGTEISSLLTTTTTTTLQTEFSQCKNQASSGPAQQWAQEQSSNLFFYQTVAGSLPTVVMTYILGLYTHQLGRKFVLILTMFGNVVQYAIWLLIIYYRVSNKTEKGRRKIRLLSNF